MHATHLFRTAVAGASWRVVTARYRVAAQRVSSGVITPFFSLLPQGGRHHFLSTSSAQLGGFSNERNSETSTAPISSKAWEDLIRELCFHNITLSENIRTTIQHLQRPLPEIHGIKPTRLYSFLNRDSKPSTEELNDTVFRALPGPTFTFSATDKLQYRHGKHHMTGLAFYQVIAKLRRCAYATARLCEPLAPRRLELKPGTQVILLASIYGLSKGARGVVTGFENINRDEYEADKEAGCAVPPLRDFCRRTERWRNLEFPIRVPMVVFHALYNGEGAVAKRVYPYPLQRREEFCAPGVIIPSAYAKATRVQIPLRHAWAMTTEEVREWGVGQMDYAKIDVECLRSKAGNYWNPDEVLACVKGPEGLEVVGNLDLLSERGSGR